MPADDRPLGEASVRRRCRKRGHDFCGWEGSSLPYLFCRRWFCEASTVAPWVPEPLRSELAKECR